MDTHTCAQRGCEFEVEEGDELPENCPVCNNPIINGDDAGETWDDHTVDELREQAKEWGLTGYSGLNRAELIDLLDAVADDDDDDDDDDDGKGNGAD